MIYRCEGCDETKDDDFNLASMIYGKWYCEQCASALLERLDSTTTEIEADD